MSTLVPKLALRSDFQQAMVWAILILSSPMLPAYANPGVWINTKLSVASVKVSADGTAYAIENKTNHLWRLSSESSTWDWLPGQFQSVYPLDSQSVWAVKRDGRAYYTNGQFWEERFGRGLRDLVVTTDGETYALTAKQQLLSWSRLKRRWLRLQTDTLVRKIGRADNGALWLLSADNRILKYRRGRLQQITIIWSSRNNNDNNNVIYKRIASGTAGSLYISLKSGGIYKLDSTFRATLVSELSGREKVIDFLPGPNGRIWGYVDSRQILWRYVQDEEANPGSVDNSQTDSAQSFKRKHSGALPALEILPIPRNTSVYFRTKQTRYRFKNLNKTDKGHALFISDQGRVFRYQRGKFWRIKNVADAQSAVIVGNSIWWVTEDGTVRTSSSKTIRGFVLPDRAIDIQTSLSGRVLVLTTSGRVYQYLQSRDEFNELIINARLRSVAVDTSGRVYGVRANDGVLLTCSISANCAPAVRGLHDFRSLSLVPASRTLMLIAKGQLFLRRFGSQALNRLSSDVTKGMIDSGGRLWIIDGFGQLRVSASSQVTGGGRRFRLSDISKESSFAKRPRYLFSKLRYLSSKDKIVSLARDGSVYVSEIGTDPGDSAYLYDLLTRRWKSPISGQRLFENCPFDPGIANPMKLPIYVAAVSKDMLIVALEEETSGSPPFTPGVGLVVSWAGSARSSKIGDCATIAYRLNIVPDPSCGESKMEIDKNRNIFLKTKDCRFVQVAPKGASGNLSYIKSFARYDSENVLFDDLKNFSLSGADLIWLYDKNNRLWLYDRTSRKRVSIQHSFNNIEEMSSNKRGDLVIIDDGGRVFFRDAVQSGWGRIYWRKAASRLRLSDQRYLWVTDASSLEVYGGIPQPN